ncbi:hypothetical protein Q8A67_004579 [Cirrhinus molitorella]|uniref:Uncharacterized protein n=1 Tax=Cirrhinus molitorella TaxID=172907 RepID=A0AA88Q9Y1_9TELE|nr:hypothetical protein Q8A67_004579 [Cirrhinus molitorella]
MSTLSSDTSVAESEGVPDSLDGSRSDTPSGLEGFNRLDVFNLGTINVYNETDGGDDSDYIEVFSLSSATSDNEVGMSLISYESHSDGGSFVSRQNAQMCCNSMLMHNGGSDDSLALLSISSTSSSENRIIYRPPMRNASLNPPQTSSNFVNAPGPSVSLDIHSDKEACSMESTSIGGLNVDSVDNSAENHVSLRKKVKNRIHSFFKRAWKTIKHPSLCCETGVEPFMPPTVDTEPDQEQDNAESSRPAEPTGFQPNDESEEFGYEMEIAASGGFGTMNEETPPSNGKQTEDAECSISDTSEDDCEEYVIVCGPFSILREKPVHRLGEWSFNSDLFIGKSGSDDSLYLLSISSGTSSAEEPSGTWQNGPARETCTCSCNRNAAGPSSMGLEAQSDNED